MSHFAKIRDNQVEEVIVAEQDFVDGIPLELGVRWIQTSYNTLAGQHAQGGTPLRKNFAGVGYTYSDELDAFIPPQPSPHWILNQSTCQWEPPYAPPQDGLVYTWNDFIPGWEITTYYGPHS
jgi:hypothetical protein